MRRPRVIIEGEPYNYLPITPPKADGGSRSEGIRIIVRHGHDDLEVIAADPEVVTSGWVIGTNAMKDTKP
jgi:hypothetical protein